LNLDFIANPWSVIELVFHKFICGLSYSESVHFKPAIWYHHPITKYPYHTWI